MLVAAKGNFFSCQSSRLTQHALANPKSMRKKLGGNWKRKREGETKGGGG